VGGGIRAAGEVERGGRGGRGRGGGEEGVREGGVVEWGR